MTNYFLTSLIALTAASTVQAQTTYYWPALEQAQGHPGVKYFLPAGTLLPMRTLTQVSTKYNKPGDRIHLEVAENVIFRDQIVIPAGAPVLAEVAATQRNGHFGKKGKIQIRLIEVQTPHGPVRLTGDAADEGKSGTALSIGTMLFVTSLGFLIHGTSATIPPGTTVMGQLNSDLKFRWYPAAQSAERSTASQVATSSASSFNF